MSGELEEELHIGDIVKNFLSQDVDECVHNKPCPHGKFCVNSEGSHRCVKCDKVSSDDQD